MNSKVIPILEGDIFEFSKDMEKIDFPETLPLLSLRDNVLFPDSLMPVNVGRKKSLKAIAAAQKNPHHLIVVVPQFDPNVEEPNQNDLFLFGVVATVVKLLELPDGNQTVILHGIRRVELLAMQDDGKYNTALVRYLTDNNEYPDTPNGKVLLDSIKESAIKLFSSRPLGGRDHVDAFKNISNPRFIINFIASTIEVDDITGKFDLLSCSDLFERGLMLLKMLKYQLSILDIQAEINSKVTSEINQQQREYYLNNQLKTIQEELGVGEDKDFDELEEKANKKHWSKEIRAIFDKEFARLQRVNPNGPEYGQLWQYLQFMLDLPWDDMSEDNLDISNAVRVLDNDHFGLEKVKERIIEYLAVLKLKGNLKSPILCLYGPPGVGKTSLGKSIAKALGRQYQRIALGGMHDESEIRGHRRTYIGAMPGRVLSSLEKAGTSNPVIVLDEIDKVSASYHGDPSAALLEVLDPEQNTTFHDNYLDVDYDLSNVMFITTANDISGIPTALKDRMEMIPVSGYLAEEKQQIAKTFLIPKQLKEHGLKARDLSITPDGIAKVISDYTRESGVRGLEKQIAKLIRITAKKMALGESYAKKLGAKQVQEYLGLPVAFHDIAAEGNAVGVATGLAWTSVGGEILFIESLVSEAAGERGAISITGNLGDVMKESAQIAYQYLKAHPELVGLEYREFLKKDIHIHCPEGATPKDGPSAGITLVSSMASALKDKPLKIGVAMTGEMTLRGLVLPVGGIKEKILAAKRSGIDTIVLSEKNRKDIEDIPQQYVDGLTFKYVKTIDQVIKFVL